MSKLLKTPYGDFADDGVRESTRLTPPLMDSESAAAVPAFAVFPLRLTHDSPNTRVLDVKSRLAAAPHEVRCFPFLGTAKPALLQSFRGRDP